MRVVLESTRDKEYAPGAFGDPVSTSGIWIARTPEHTFLVQRWDRIGEGPTPKVYWTIEPKSLGKAEAGTFKWLRERNLYGARFRTRRDALEVLEAACDY